MKFRSYFRANFPSIIFSVFLASNILVLLVTFFWDYFNVVEIRILETPGKSPIVKVLNNYRNKVTDITIEVKYFDSVFANAKKNGWQLLDVQQPKPQMRHNYWIWKGSNKDNEISLGRKDFIEIATASIKPCKPKSIIFRGDPIYTTFEDYNKIIKNQKIIITVALIALISILSFHNRYRLLTKYKNLHSLCKILNETENEYGFKFNYAKYVFDKSYKWKFIRQIRRFFPGSSKEKQNDLYLSVCDYTWQIYCDEKLCYEIMDIAIRVIIAIKICEN